MRHSVFVLFRLILLFCFEPVRINSFGIFTQQQIVRGKHFDALTFEKLLIQLMEEKTEELRMHLISAFLCFIAEIILMDLICMVIYVFMFSQRIRKIKLTILASQ